MSQLTCDVGRVISLLKRTPAWEALGSKLKMRDTVFIVDDSGSMNEGDILTRDGRKHSRWEVAQDLLEVIGGVLLIHACIVFDALDVLFCCSWPST
jgi:hypothetical protein